VISGAVDEPRAGFVERQQAGLDKRVGARLAAAFEAEFGKER